MKKQSSRWSLGSFGAGNTMGTQNPLTTSSSSVIRDSVAGGMNGGGDEEGRGERVYSEGRIKLQAEKIQLEKKGQKVEGKYKELESQYKKLELKYKQVKEEMRGAEKEKEQLAKEREGKIPEGSKWQIFLDENGYDYYYNSETEACQYEKPERW